MEIWEISTTLKPSSFSRINVVNAPSASNSFLSIMAWTPILAISISFVSPLWRGLAL